MTGPEHYSEAERLLALAKATYTTLGMSAEGLKTHEANLTAARECAQVHATLALAAATAFNCDCTAGEWPGWVEVAASDLTKKDGDYS